MYDGQFTTLNEAFVISTDLYTGVLKYDQNIQEFSFYKKIESCYNLTTRRTASVITHG